MSEDDRCIKRTRRAPYLPVPYSDVILYDGNIVMFGTHPCKKWVVHHGVFKFEDIQYDGWYFVSIPDQSLMPVHLEDLITVVKLANTVNPRKHHKHPKPPLPPGPDISIFTVDDRERLDRAWITVESISDRDSIPAARLHDGCVVQVNDVDGVSKVYRWSAETSSWVDYELATVSDIESRLPKWEIV